VNGDGPLSAGVAVRPCTPDDVDALLALHRAGFVAQWDQALWRWRFVDNPSGHMEITGAFTPDGRCLAAFAGIPLPCRYTGEAGAVQAGGDVVVLPELRRSFAGAQLLAHVGEFWFQRAGDQFRRMVFGCPEPPLLRTVVRRLRCEVFGDVAFLVRELPTSAAPATAAQPPPQPLAQLPDDVDALWQRCAGELHTAIVRDRAYLSWRYVRHPRVRYAFLAVRADRGPLRGLCVVRDGGYHDAVFSLVDWLVPRADREAERQLLDGAEQLARAHGRRFLLAMFSPASVELQRFQADHGFHLRVTPHQQVFRPYAAGIDRQFLFENWHQTMGDLDFV
jgi:hypothetical protein